MKPPTEALAVHVRWAIRADYPAIADIEQRAFDFPWQEKDFVRYARKASKISLTAEHRESRRVVGYVCYHLLSDAIRIDNLAVDYGHRLQGVGRAMIEKLQGKLGSRRTRIATYPIRISNLDAQLFFRALGFRHAVAVKNPFNDTREDGVVMAYRLGGRIR